MVHSDPTESSEREMAVGPTFLVQHPLAEVLKAFLASLRIAPGVRAHSIIAVKGEGPPEEGNDGVVKYTSAHPDGVDSELVVRSGHSCQATPEAIEEVRRILYQHLDQP